MLLDLRLPDMDGLDVCRQLRARSDVPIIVVTARGEEVDRVVGLELGADDYVVKPFGLRELIARIRAVTRRTGRGRRRRARCACGELAGRRARPPRDASTGSELELTPKEFDLLAALARDPGAAISRRRLLEESGTRAGTARRRRSTSTSPRCAGSSATRPGSRPCAASASACAT